MEFAQSAFCSEVMEKETEAFRFTFTTLASALGEDSFRKVRFLIGNVIWEDSPYQPSNRWLWV